MSFLDEETIELYLQKGRLALIVEMSRADYLEADAQAQAAWRARLAGLTELDAADLQRWYALEHLEALFDMLSHPRLRREAGMALCHREIGARCEALVPLIPELGAYATRVMHKHMSLERRLQLARSLPVSQAVLIVGEDDLNAEAVEFLASLLTAAEDAGGCQSRPGGSAAPALGQRSLGPRRPGPGPGRLPPALSAGLRTEAPALLG